MGPGWLRSRRQTERQIQEEQLLVVIAQDIVARVEQESWPCLVLQ